MGTLEVLGCIALVIFLAPYAFAIVAALIGGCVDFYSWCEERIKQSRNPFPRCSCPRVCPLHKRTNLR